jgi:hypothetical protein
MTRWRVPLAFSPVALGLTEVTPACAAVLAVTTPAIRLTPTAGGPIPSGTPNGASRNHWLQKISDGSTALSKFLGGGWKCTDVAAGLLRNPARDHGLERGLGVPDNGSAFTARLTEWPAARLASWDHHRGANPQCSLPELRVSPIPSGIRGKCIEGNSASKTSADDAGRSHIRARSRNSPAAPQATVPGDGRRGWHGPSWSRVGPAPLPAARPGRHPRLGARRSSPLPKQQCMHTRMAAPGVYAIVGVGLM